MTANPQVIKYVSERQDSPFHATVSLLDQWNSKIQTIHPSDVYEAALRIDSKYPNKRLIVHFLQPHAPFIGPTANQIRRRTGKTIGGLDPGRSYTKMPSQSIETTSYRGMLRSENITIDDVRAAYRETLAITTNYILNLVGNLDGKTAISSDHGELLGDRLHPGGVQRWEHPRGVRAPELCLVPWIECPYDERKEIRSEPAENSIEIDQEVVDERLRSLGYV